MRQPLLFGLVGGLQYLVDGALFALLISAGIGTSPANVTSRACAAGLGFVLNRYLTFGQREETVGRLARSLLRFALLWVSLTLLSTLAVLGLEQLWGAGTGQRIAAKLVVEAVLAVASFLLSRYWVFRN